MLLYSTTAVTWMLTRQPSRKLALLATRAALLATLCASLLLLSSQRARAADEERGSPAASTPAYVKIEVFPPQVTLTDSRSQSQVVVTAWDAHNNVYDVTNQCELTVLDPEIAAVSDARVTPKSDGATELEVRLGEQRQRVPVQANGTNVKRPVAFESEVLVALSTQGCNSGACHGSPSGKGGFRLSLRAFDPQLDALTLTQEEFGRRINVLEPERSLLLQKPLMQVAHGGGVQLRKHNVAYGILRDWIAEGGRVDPPQTPRVVKLDVYPKERRVLRAPHHRQQLAVIAHFADGTARDVTLNVAYLSSNQSVATVGESGLVKGSRRGEAAILVRFLEHVETLPLMFVEDVPDFHWPDRPQANEIDRLVDAKLRQLSYAPAEVCTDAEFLRRVSLDLTGLLPKLEDTKAFLASTDPQKRAQLVDKLLDQPEFAKFWALKWGDWLRLTGKRIGDDGIFKYHRWIENAIRENMPYDQFVSQLVAASGSTLSNPPANFYRTAGDMHECVETFSQVFLGARLQCAKCHNHPFERWTQDNYYGLGAFFDRVQRKKTARPGETFVWYSDAGEVVQPRTGQVMKPWLPAEGPQDIPNDVDRRGALADWLTRHDNPYLARIEVNRIWGELFARGIVDPIDDFRDSNPPSNSELLDWLTEQFVSSGCDRKHIIRTIVNSRSYQASYRTTDDNAEDVLYFSHQEPRLLSAEQLLDAINHVTGVVDSLGSLPEATRATQLPAPDLVKLDFLKVFGQPERSTVCACERTSESNLGMAIEFFNGPFIHQKLRNEQNRFRKAMASGLSDEAIITDLYLLSVCRPPSPAELELAMKQMTVRGDRAAAFEDICWALLNTDEFLFQH
ncbi:MAG: DUF1549 domain-containing protein [Aureliella sp.]